MREIVLSNSKYDIIRAHFPVDAPFFLTAPVTWFYENRLASFYQSADFIFQGARSAQAKTGEPAECATRSLVCFFYF
jgi:hypothetical protein